MRLLDRYLLRELLVPLGFCLGGFLILWVVSDFAIRLSDFQELKLRGGEIIRWYVISLPEVIVTILPVSLLLALLYALTAHAKGNEITAIRVAFDPRPLLD